MKTINSWNLQRQEVDPVGGRSAVAGLEVEAAERSTLLDMVIGLEKAVKE
jgi:hypothetical protein